jgi:hypothetical protein
MYYDKAFEQMQKSGSRAMALPQPTKVDCLYDLHYKCVPFRRCQRPPPPITQMTRAAASLRIKALSLLNGRSATGRAAAAASLPSPPPPPPPLLLLLLLSLDSPLAYRPQQMYGKGKRSVH